MELQQLTNIPVFDGLASHEHPLRDLLPARCLNAGGRTLDAEDENLLELLQAALLETLA